MGFRLFGLYACMAACNRWVQVLADSPLPFTSTLERLGEFLALRHVWITLRQQLHECLSPGQGRVVGQLLK